MSTFSYDVREHKVHMQSEKNSDNILLWLVAAGFFMETLDGTIVNTALPSMAKALNESPLYMQSVIIAYALTLAVLIPASGWLTDRFGIRRVYVGAKHYPSSFFPVWFRESAVRC